MLRIKDLGHLICFTLGVSLSLATELPPDSEYVVVRDGHLTLNGQRQRYWGVIGSFPNIPKLSGRESDLERVAKVAKARKEADAIVNRFSDLGFNLVRYWYAAGTQGQTPNATNPRSVYTKGDGSPDDMADYFLFRLKERGFRIWTAGLNRLGMVTPEDVTILDEAATADAWRAAIIQATAKRNAKDGKASLGWPIRGSIAGTWDPRLEALAIARMEAIATHMNQYTGLRWCDDPLFSVWELSNEEWWIHRMLGGAWQKLPDFFRNQLIVRWNEYLRRKYESDGALCAAWQKLLPGESLVSGSVLFAPMRGETPAAASLNDANPQAIASLQSIKQNYRREDFSEARANDVLAFLLELQLAHKQRLAAAVKSWGKSSRISPLVFDTGLGYDIRSQYMHQQFDASAHDAYTNGWGPKFKMPDLDALPNEQQRQVALLGAERISSNTGPWINWLLKPPGLAQGVPWLETGRMENKPFFAYETQIQQPAKYRADYPLRILAAAVIQDWDVVCWHYWGPSPNASEEKPYDRQLDVSSGSHPQGYHFTNDEVQSAMIRAAGNLFRLGAYKPAARPTVFVFGRKSLLAGDGMNIAGSYGIQGMDMAQTTYQYGSRVRIDPNSDEDQVLGPVVKFEDRNTHNPYSPTEELCFDWKKGYLSLEASAGVSWTGLLGRVGNELNLKHGFTLSQVHIINPPGSFDPVSTEENYIAFSCYAQDGLPLRECKRASLSLVSTSFNSGFKLDLTKHSSGGHGLLPGAVTPGKLPVLVSRVGGVVCAPALAGMHYTVRDWHMKNLEQGIVGSDGRLVIKAEQPVFVIELVRP